MITAEELTEAVTFIRSDRGAYNGVSDHQPHVQCLVKTGHAPIVCCTFNVLNPRLIGFTSCVRYVGDMLPANITPETQAGLEHIPAVQFGCEDKRQRIIQRELELFMQNNGDRWLLCVQECWKTLRAALLATAARFGAHTVSSPKSRTNSSFAVMVVSKGLEFELQQSEQDSVAVWLFEMQLLVVTAHMNFRTKINIELLQKLLHGINCDTLVLGDFNVQTQPLSTAAKQQGATHTLQQLAAWLELQYAVQARFALHPSGFTNYNNRINCVWPEHNEEHMDNIMLLSRAPARYSTKAIEFNITFE